jgi:hypothetical protein
MLGWVVVWLCTRCTATHTYTSSDLILTNPTTTPQHCYQTFYIGIKKLHVSPNKKNITYTALEALFNLDETQLANTLHTKNDAKHTAAQKAADGDSEEEEQQDSASKEHDLERSPRDTAGNKEEDSNKTIT